MFFSEIFFVNFWKISVSMVINKYSSVIFLVRILKFSWIFLKNLRFLGSYEDPDFASRILTCFTSVCFANSEIFDSRAEFSLKFPDFTRFLRFFHENFSFENSWSKIAKFWNSLSLLVFAEPMTKNYWTELFGACSVADLVLIAVKFIYYHGHALKISENFWKKFHFWKKIFRSEKIFIFVKFFVNFLKFHSLFEVFENSWSKIAKFWNSLSLLVFAEPMTKNFWIGLFGARQALILRFSAQALFITMDTLWNFWKFLKIF